MSPVEREVRSLKGTVFILFLLLAALAAYTLWPSRTGTLIAERIELQDENGVHAVLEITDGSPSLRFVHKDSTSLELTDTSWGGKIVLYDKRYGQERFNISLAYNGNPRILMRLDDGWVKLRPPD